MKDRTATYKSIPSGIKLTYRNGMLKETAVTSGDKIVYDALRHFIELFESDLCSKFFKLERSLEITANVVG